MNLPFNPQLEGASSFPLTWPVQLADLHLTEQEQAILVNFFKAVNPQIKKCYEPSRSFAKQIIHPVGITRWRLPISVTFLFNAAGKLKGVVLLLNSTRGKAFKEGGQRVPKTAYELLRGIFVVKKNILDNEEQLIDHLMQRKRCGAAQIFGKRAIWDKKSGIRKKQYFEALYQGDLGSRIGSLQLFNPIYSLFIIHSLLKELQTLQQLQIEKWEKTGKTYSSFHGDIKPWNILIGERGVAFTDYGMSNQTSGRAGSLGYACPILFNHMEMTPSEIREFLEENGKKLDLWSLGVVLVVLLRNQFSSYPGLQLFCPPLAFIEKRIHRGRFHQFGEVTQQEVDEELSRNKEIFATGPYATLLGELWDLAAHFLKVNLQQTATLDDALTRTNVLLELYAPKTKQFMDVS